MCVVDSFFVGTVVLVVMGVSMVPGLNMRLSKDDSLNGYYYYNKMQQKNTKVFVKEEKIFGNWSKVILCNTV